MKWDIFDDSSVWRGSAKAKPLPTPPAASGDGPGSALSLHSRHTLWLETTSSCSPNPTLYPTAATTPHPDPAKKFRLPKKRIPYRLKEEALQILKDGHAAKMPKGVKSPVLEWEVTVVGLKGEKREVRTAGWEGVVALRERIAKLQSIYPARKLFLRTWPEHTPLQDGETVSEVKLAPGSTIYCTLLADSHAPVSRWLPLPEPPPPLPLVWPIHDYPAWIKALLTNNTNDLVTLYASILTYHFPPYQSFAIHSYMPSGALQGFAMYHPLHPYPLLTLLHLSDDDFAHAAAPHPLIPAFTPPSSNLNRHPTYLICICEQRWIAFFIRPQADIMPSELDLQPIVQIQNSSLVSDRSYSAFTLIAEDLKSSYLPNWHTPHEETPVVRLPRFRIPTAVSMAQDIASYFQSESSAVYPDRPEPCLFWSDPPGIIHILPPVLPDKQLSSSRRANVRLPAIG